MKRLIGVLRELRAICDDSAMMSRSHCARCRGSVDRHSRLITAAERQLIALLFDVIASDTPMLY